MATPIDGTSETLAAAGALDELARYNAGARAFHWVLAALIIGNLFGGIFHDAIGDWVMPLHTATGLLILLLSIGRIGWRLTHRPPPMAGIARWERIAAGATYAIFYAFMLAVPLTGWIMASAGRWPISFYGLFDVWKWPVRKGEALPSFSHEAHEILGYAFAALVVVHIAAALRHHFLLKDNVLRRMLG